LLHELDGFLLHALLQGLAFLEAMTRGVVPHVLGDLHGAEVGAAHGAEVGHLGAFLGQGLVVEFPGLVRVQAQVELVFPAEFEAGLAQGVVPDLGAGVALGQVGSAAWAASL